jgi:hypothetical protein
MAERILGDIATKLLMENDRVRIWEFRLEPGERSAVHRHDLDYVMIQIDGDHVAADFEPDSKDPYGAAGDRIEGEVVPGLALYSARGGIETAVNTGNRTFHEIIVELKD